MEGPLPGIRISLWWYCRLTCAALLWMWEAPAPAAQAAGSAAPSRATTQVAATARLELHSDVWISLHHFLYQWARAGASKGGVVAGSDSAGGYPRSRVDTRAVVEHNARSRNIRQAENLLGGELSCREPAVAPRGRSGEITGWQGRLDGGLAVRGGPSGKRSPGKPARRRQTQWRCARGIWETAWFRPHHCCRCAPGRNPPGEPYPRYPSITKRHTHATQRLPLPGEVHLRRPMQPADSGGGALGSWLLRPQRGEERVARGRPLHRATVPAAPTPDSLRS
jgi:hypothetical protein